MTTQEEYKQELKKQARKLLAYRFGGGIPVKRSRIFFAEVNKTAKLIIKSSSYCETCNGTGWIPEVYQGEREGSCCQDC